MVSTGVLSRRTKDRASQGGSDTTTSVISAFFLCMVRHPEAQKTAQEELDRVLGRGVLPTFADRQALPYVGAVLLEVMRLFPFYDFQGFPTA